MIRNLGNDGRRLHIPRGQIYEWRKAFAQALQEHGVKADANTRCRKKAESTEEAAPNADKKQE
jgi:type IV secretion system T-DNA border endonuclease VirD2